MSHERVFVKLPSGNYVDLAAVIAVTASGDGITRVELSSGASVWASSVRKESARVVLNRLIAAHSSAVQS